MSEVERDEYVFPGGGKGGNALTMEPAQAGKRGAIITHPLISESLNVLLSKAPARAGLR
jgi:hypothetical protein